MHLTETPDGELLIHCFAGCDSAEILRELRRRAGLDTPRRRRETGLTLQQYAEAKQFSPDALQSWGVSDALYDGKPALRIEYRDTDGNLIATQYRLALEGDRFRWKAGDAPKLYGLWRLREWHGGRLWVVEGASDCHTLWHAGFQAIAIPSASAKQLAPELWKCAERFEHIYLCFDADGAGVELLQAVVDACPPDLQERVSVVRLPDGVKDVSELWLRVDGSLPAFINHLNQCEKVPFSALERAAPSKPATPAETDAKPEREAACLRLAKAALERIPELFTTPDGEIYATVQQQAHLETHALESKAFENYLAALCSELGIVPREATLTETRAILRGEAARRGETREVYIRVGGDPETAIYLDLCTPDWRVVEIKPSGWRQIDYADCPIRFTRPRYAQPLPTPTQGDIHALRRFLRVSDGDFLLILGWLLMALRPDAPYPILALRGEQGSGKSTATRLLRGLVDPRTSAHAAAPHKLDDLMVAAAQAHIVAFDNLSRIPPWLSDALCRLATGAGLEKRELYSDAEVVVLYARRPVMMNAIREIIERPDLADRTLQVELLSIPEHERLPERDLLQAWQGARAGILGALLDGVSRAMRDFQRLRLPEVPRMADFAVWAAAGVQAWGYTAQEFLNAYRANRAALSEQLTERDILATAIVTLMDGREVWEGTASDLLRSLAETVADGEKAYLPKPNKLRNCLLEIAPLLRPHGIRYTYCRGGSSRRVHRLEKCPTQPSLPSQPSLDADFELNSAARAVTIPRDDRTVSSLSIVTRIGANLNSTTPLSDGSDGSDGTVGDFQNQPTPASVEGDSGECVYGETALVPPESDAHQESPLMDDSDGASALMDAPAEPVAEDGETLAGDALVDAILNLFGGRELIGREKFEHLLQQLQHDPLEFVPPEALALAREVWELAERHHFPALAHPHLPSPILPGERAWADAMYLLIGDPRLHIVLEQLKARRLQRNGKGALQPSLFTLSQGGTQA